MSKFDVIVDQCIVGDEKKRKWRYAVSNYNAAMKILHQKNAYSDNDKQRFQLHVDRSYLTFRSMYGRDIATNYWHMLSSGHILWFMNRLHNLNRYSNQGWEALNRLMKSFINRRTNKGGGQDKTKSKLRPVANLFLRRLVWTFGLNSDFDPTKKYLRGSPKDAEIFDVE